MTYLPPEISPDDEVEVTWEADEYSTKVVATLGEVSISVECSEEGAELVPWLVAALPNILDAAWRTIERENEETEK